MIKLVFILILLSFDSGFAALSAKNQVKFKKICKAQSKALKSKNRLCNCYLRNVRWLLNDGDMKFAEKIINKKISGKELMDSKNGEAMLADLLVNIEINCNKNFEYLAPKAEALKSKR